MASFQIDLTGAIIPTYDGQVSRYVHPEAAAQLQYFSQARRVIFVNGMKNTGADHAYSALALSLVQMCPVIGVYNRSDGVIKDLLQCLSDKDQFNGPISMGASTKAAVGRVLTGRSSEQVIVDALKRNPAQVSLFHLLRDPSNANAEIFAHSQGNLILSNALQGIAAVDGPAAIHGRVVHTFGSPTVHWPDGIQIHEHGFTFDPVNWLSGFDPSFRISKLGMPNGSFNPITHSFLEYMANDPAFVVNRFRIGSWGMTFNMDEKGLANCLVAMGTNMPRVHRLFAHLNAKHNSDADDVAVLYLESIKTSSPIVNALAADQSLVELLMRILDEGWTTDREKQLIGWLKTVR